jgi:16S rRNA (cytosine967-C5)-methyltransferase
MTEPLHGGDTGAATRALAARAVAGVLGDGQTLDDALRRGDLAALPAPDRSQVKALAFGALRWHHRHLRLLDDLLDRPLASGDKLLEALLSVGIFQLLDERQPEYAAVSATVEAARRLGLSRATGLVNATLRRLQRERAALLARALATDSGRFSCPDWLIGRVRRDWPDDWSEILGAALRPPALWLRVNRLRQEAAACRRRLADAGIPAEGGTGLAEALRLHRPMAVAGIPGFREGEVTVQDAASQLAAHLLAPSPGMRALDACAAPGGKATHLIEHAGGELDLVALDIDDTRLARLHENLQRLGLRARTLAGDARRPQSWWDERPFDCILVDAPCSGTGVIRRHPDIKFLRRESDIAPMAARQLAILDALWPLLRPGGRLLYATCSIVNEENTEVARNFLATHPDAALAEAPAPLPAWARPQRDGGWQCLPGPADTDGIYYALMTRHRA